MVSSEMIGGIIDPLKGVITIEDVWEIFTLADAYAPRELLKYIVEGLFPLPSLSIVYGAPSTLKSMLLGDLITHIAGGVSWLGRGVLQSPVLWIDFDNGKRRTHERFESLGRAAKITTEAPLYYTSMPNPWLDAGDEADMKALKRRILSCQAKFIVIDNLALIAPNADENSDGMVKVMGNLRNLSEQTGAAIVSIHHQRKSSSDKRVGETLRGHSSIEAAIDLALLIEREEGSNIIRIHSTKTRDVEVLPFAAEYRFEHKPDNTELKTSYFVLVENDNQLPGKQLEETIVSIVKEAQRINQSKIVEEVKKKHARIGEKHIRGIIDKLEKNGHLKWVPGPRGAKVYHIE